MSKLIRAAILLAILLAVAAGPSLALTYTVVKDDTLSGISKKYYGSMQYWPELQRYNNIANANLIYPGDKVDIPNVEVMSAMIKATTTAEKEKIASQAKANGGTLAPATPADPNSPASGFPASVSTSKCGKCGKVFPTKPVDATQYNTTVYSTHIASCSGGQSLPFDPKNPNNPHGSNYDALKGLDTDN